MRLKLTGAISDGQDPFERRFGLKRSKLPEHVRAAVEQAVTLVHRGSMATIETSYSALMRYIGDHGLRTLGYSREVYLDCPENIDEWVTELQFAVAPA